MIAFLQDMVMIHGGSLAAMGIYVVAVTVSMICDEWKR